MAHVPEFQDSDRCLVAGIREDEVFDHLRSDDGEHVGYIGITAGDLFVPYDLLHRRRGEPAELDAAETVLDEIGLRMLAEDWLLRVEAGALPGAEGEPESETGSTWVPVRIREVTRDRVVVNRLLDDAPSHIAKAMDLTHDVVLDLPTDRLVPRA